MAVTHTTWTNSPRSTTGHLYSALRYLELLVNSMVFLTKSDCVVCLVKHDSDYAFQYSFTTDEGKPIINLQQSPPTQSN